MTEITVNYLILRVFFIFLCHKSSKFNHLEESMGYKKMKQNLGFADLALASSMKHNRSLKNMEKLNDAIYWSRVDTILMNHYTIGTSGEGADAYPPLLRYKCLLLQKWFHIDSDPELENQRDLCVTQFFGTNS
jgi:hypothetical protein